MYRSSLSKGFPDWVLGAVLPFLLSACGANVVSEVCKPVVKVALQSPGEGGSGTGSSEEGSAATQAETEAKAAVVTKRKEITDQYLSNYLQEAVSFSRRSTVDAANANNTATTLSIEFKGIVPTDALTATASTFFDSCIIYLGNVRAFSCRDLSGSITFTPNTTANTTTMQFALNSTTLASSTNLNQIFAIGNDATVGTPITTLINQIKTGTLGVSVVFITRQIKPISTVDLGGRVVYRLFAEPSGRNTALDQLEF